jgi:hypothetical protein
MLRRDHDWEVAAFDNLKRRGGELPLRRRWKPGYTIERSLDEVIGWLDQFRNDLIPILGC